MGRPPLSVFLIVALAALSPTFGQSGSVAEPVIGARDHLTVPVGGLERTNATAETVKAHGPGFDEALRVVIRGRAAQTNETQLTIPIRHAVKVGDVLLGELWVRGSATVGKVPASIEFLFEKSTDPWTKSVTEAAIADKDASVWKHCLIPFKAIATFQPGEAMVSLRFATQPQTVEVGGLRVVDYGTSQSLEHLVESTAEMNPIGNVEVRFDFSKTRQTMIGMGGDFCQPRYGATEPMDAVGRYVLTHLRVSHARLGLPLNYWTPERGVYSDTAQAHASFLALQEMKKRGIPRVLSIWEAPQWLLGGSHEQMGRVLPPAEYSHCIDAIVRYLTTARDKYGVTVDYLSFNEPDYGVNFKFTPRTMVDFIRQAGPVFAAEKLGTKFLVGDTGGGSSFHDYAAPILADKAIAQYLGPLSFHCWDGLTATAASYEAIAQLGREYHKPVWCLEVGHDASLWQAPNPWASWDNALKTAEVYERTVRLTSTSLMDYWTYEDNYPLVDRAGKDPFPVFHAIHQMQAVLAPGAKISIPALTTEVIQALGTVEPNGTVAILVVNPGGPGMVTLRGLPRRAKLSVLLSDHDRQEVLLAPVRADADGVLHLLRLPARSIVTVVSGH